VIELVDTVLIYRFGVVQEYCSAIAFKKSVYRWVFFGVWGLLYFSIVGIVFLYGG
jgi:hypothetical protein